MVDRDQIVAQPTLFWLSADTPLDNNDTVDNNGHTIVIIIHRRLTHYWAYPHVPKI